MPVVKTKTLTGKDAWAVSKMAERNKKPTKPPLINLPPEYSGYSEEKTIMGNRVTYGVQSMLSSKHGLFQMSNGLQSHFRLRELAKACEEKGTGNRFMDRHLNQFLRLRKGPFCRFRMREEEKDLSHPLGYARFGRLNKKQNPAVARDRFIKRTPSYGQEF